MLTVKFAFWLVIAADTRKEIQKTIKTKKKPNLFTIYLSMSRVKWIQT